MNAENGEQNSILISERNMILHDQLSKIKNKYSMLNKENDNLKLELNKLIKVTKASNVSFYSYFQKERFTEFFSKRLENNFKLKNFEDQNRKYV